jgi:hypothetical protein
MSNQGGFSEEAFEKYQRLLSEKEGVEFSEGETYDFTRCMRPNGTFYGTRGKCKKGSETGAKEPEAPKAASGDSKESAYKPPAYNPNPELNAKVARAMARKKGDTVAEKAADKALKEIRKKNRELKAGVAAKRESRKAMTPEQRKEEREWNKQRKLLG